jgi:spore coat polysaccharide biosynthesis predicted glycosyltransferase SpsG
MFALCIKASHQRGLGHLFRGLVLIRAFQRHGVPYTVFINDDPRAREILEQNGTAYHLAEYEDLESGWEIRAINDLGIGLWINDRLDTDLRHALHVKDSGIPLVTFDDCGSGAALADLHIAALAQDASKVLFGLRVLKGCAYLILNEEIAQYRWLRSNSERILVTLGGSDTYGATVKVVNILKALGKRATVVIGPSFAHKKQLEEVSDGGLIEVIGSVQSLIRLFYDYDLAVTGAGITPYEANASGLPCIVIANESFEIPNALFLEQAGGSVYAGFHDRLNETVFDQQFDIGAMSEKGMYTVPLDGVENVYMEIMSLWSRR